MVASDEVVTVNADSITFAVGNTGTATNGQARITNIEIVYTDAEGEDTDIPVDPEEPCEHTYDNECDASCNNCGEERVPPHKYGAWTETTAGTCTTPSTETRYCEHDASHFETREGSINPDNHAWGEWTEVTPGTCSTPAKLERVCSHDANHKETKDGDIVANNHAWGEWTETTHGNCVTPGVDTRVCQNDPTHVETRTGSLDENAHRYDDEYDAECNDCHDVRDVPERPTFTLGDIDGKNGVNNSDLIMLRRYLAGWSVEINEDAANLDGRGGVNNSDAIWLARYLAGWDGYELDA